MLHANFAPVDAALAAIRVAPGRIFNITGPGDRLAELVARGEEILALANAEQRDLTPDEVRAFDRLEAEFNRDRGEALLDAYRGQSRQSVGRRTDPDPLDHGGDGSFQARPGAAASRIWGTLPRNAAGPSNIIYAGAQRDSHGFRDAFDFFASALSGRYDPRFANAAQQMVEYSGEQGGFFVPPAISADLVDNVFAASNILPLVRTFPMTSRNCTYPRYATSDRSTGLLAGFTGHWVGEAQDDTLQKAKVEALEVTAQKLMILSAMSGELLTDSPIFASSFQPMLSKASAYSLDRALVRGTGAGMPLGMLADSALITVAAEGGQAADTFNFKNAAKMYAALYSAGVPRSVWLIHPTVVPQLIQMPQPVQNVAGTENVGGAPAVTISDDGTMRLLGRPVIQSEHLNPIGDLGDILLVDPTQYAFFLRREAFIETTNALHWTSYEYDVRLILRGNGMGLWSGVGKRPDSSSESWAVQLGAR